jgi:hypothetical protein
MARPVPRGTPVGKSWSFRRRRIRGKERLVKIRKVRGREQVRMAGLLVTTDMGPKKHMGGTQNATSTRFRAKNEGHTGKTRSADLLQSALQATH